MKAARHLPFLFFILFAFSNFSQAQEEKNITAELVTLSEKSNIKGLWFQTADGPRKLDVYERDFTMPEKYIGPKVIHFFVNEASLSSSPEDRPDPAAIVELPDDGGKVMLIFAPKAEQKVGWNIRALDNSLEKFPPGSYRFINLCPSEFTVILEGNESPAEPNSVTIISPVASNDTNEAHIQIGLEKEIIFSSIWEDKPDSRTTVFVAPDPNGRNGISVRRFSQAATSE